MRGQIMFSIYTDLYMVIMAAIGIIAPPAIIIFGSYTPKKDQK